jgi:hypothetical protein
MGSTAMGLVLLTGPGCRSAESRLSVSGGVSTLFASTVKHALRSRSLLTLTVTRTAVVTATEVEVMVVVEVLGLGVTVTVGTLVEV